jgi:hypothetical protein
MARQHDDNMQGENYWQNGEMLRELGIHLTIGANGQVLGIKHSVKRGVSTDLYKWTGAQPQLPKRAERTEH